MMGTGCLLGALGGHSEEQNAMGPEVRERLLKRLRTPKKLGKLVLEASYKNGSFDSLAVDVPFLFRHKGRYFMTFIGFDGIGYRTGLAVSDDLIHWEKKGLIVDRGPKGSPTEFNVALSSIVRENDLFGSGALKRFNGRFLGTYHCYPKPGYEVGPAAIGICWSDDLLHWDLEPPFLHASDPDAGPWEQGGLYKGFLLEHDDRFYLFYNAKISPPPPGSNRPAWSPPPTCAPGPATRPIRSSPTVRKAPSTISSAATPASFAAMTPG